MLASEDDIRQIYRLVLGRDADQAAIEQWLPKIQEFRITAPELTALALTTEEHRARNPGHAPRLDHLYEASGLITAAEERVAALGAPAEALETLGAEAKTWFHSFRLSDGTVINGSKSLAVLQAEFDAVFGPISLEGRSVLDIGAWNGGFSFEAMRRGAARVLAVDLLTWINPTLRGFEKFLYVRKDKNLAVDYKFLDVRDINRDNVGRFDVVLFLGVFYHLREPISILDRLADIATEDLIVETYLDAVNDVPYPAMRFFPGAELDDDPTNWWGPNVACMEALLRTAGFSEVRCHAHPMSQARGIFHARK
jgi:tRNA (mo5U34)-methyltransferase